MKVTQVQVTVHEKRNHPHEYGHYDAEVRLTADLEEGDTVAGTLDTLRTMARVEVKQECDGWIESIQIEHELARQKFEQERAARRAEWEAARRAEQDTDEDDEQGEDYSGNHEEGNA